MARGGELLRQLVCATFVDWEGQADVGAAFRCVHGRDGPAVRFGYRLDDGESQAGACAASRFVCAAEPLERPRGEAGRKTVALISDVDLKLSLLPDGEESNCPGAVAERVLDQVPERLLKSVERAPACAWVRHWSLRLACSLNTMSSGAPA